jgi:hypothetical protein
VAEVALGGGWGAGCWPWDVPARPSVNMTEKRVKTRTE